MKCGADSPVMLGGIGDSGSGCPRRAVAPSHVAGSVEAWHNTNPPGKGRAAACILGSRGYCFLLQATVRRSHGAAGGEENVRKR